MAERVGFEPTCRIYPTIRFRVGAVMTASVPLRGNAAILPHHAQGSFPTSPRTRPWGPRACGAPACPRRIVRAAAGELRTTAPPERARASAGAWHAARRDLELA